MDDLRAANSANHAVCRTQRVSVLQPIFNGGNYIREAMEGVLIQNYDDSSLRS